MGKRERKMRLFIAVELAEEMKDYLSRIQQAWQEGCSRANFSRRENLHLTIKFLGETRVEELPSIQAAMEEAARATAPFSLRLGEPGFFSRQQKKILWVGLQGDLQDLRKLFHRLEVHLAEKGFPKEKRAFSPHITLAREAVLKEGWEELSRRLCLEPRILPVTHLTLMESSCPQGKLTYLPLFRFSLQGPAGSRDC
ncbi:MAG: RNA 2',3'-cyclic phosphodiesterase [Bacillota bacterium]|jgi:2'-5' RNA ligase